MYKITVSLWNSKIIAQLGADSVEKLGVCLPSRFLMRMPALAVGEQYKEEGWDWAGVEDITIHIARVE